MLLGSLLDPEMPQSVIFLKIEGRKCGAHAGNHENRSHGRHKLCLKWSSRSSKLNSVDVEGGELNDKCRGHDWYEVSILWSTVEYKLRHKKNHQTLYMRVVKIYAAFALLFAISSARLEDPKFEVTEPGEQRWLS